MGTFPPWCYLLFTLKSYYNFFMIFSTFGKSNTKKSPTQKEPTNSLEISELLEKGLTNKP